MKQSETFKPQCAAISNPLTSKGKFMVIIGNFPINFDHGDQSI